MKRFRSGLSMVAAALLLAACGGNNPDPGPSAPAAPQNVVATAGEGFITITWQHDGQNATGFAIIRSTGTATGSQIARAESGERSYVDEDVEAGTAYRYAVAALGQGNRNSTPAQASGNQPVTPDPVPDPEPEFSAEHSTLTAAPAAVFADGSQTSVVTVSLYDTDEERIETSLGVVEIRTDLGELTSVTDHEDGTYSAALSSEEPGTATLTALLGEEQLTSQATVEFLAIPDLTQSIVSADPLSLPADGESVSTITVTLMDASGEPVEVSAGTVSMTTSLGTLGEVTDGGDGTYTAQLTSDTGGIATVAAELDGEAIGSTVEVRFSALSGPDVTTSSISISPALAFADGHDAATVTVQLRDADGAIYSLSGGAVTLATTLGVLGTVTDNGDGTYTASLTSTETGTAEVSGELDGVPFTATAEAVFDAAPDLTLSLLTADAGPFLADGTSEAEVTVTLLDSDAEPIGRSGGSLALNVSLGSASEVTDNGDGTYAAVVTSTVAGAADVSATLAGEELTDQATITFVPLPDPENSTVTADEATVPADGIRAALITVQLRDSSDNPVPISGGTVTLEATLGTLSAVMDGNDGTYTARLTSDTPGDSTVTASLNGALLSSTAAVTFEAHTGPDLETSVVSASSNLEFANGVAYSTIHVQLRYADDTPYPASGGPLEFSTTLGTIGPVTDHEDGTYSASLTSDTVGLARVTAALQGQPLADSVQVNFDAAPHMDTSTLSAAPVLVFADGASEAVVQVALRNAADERIMRSGGELTVMTDLGVVEPVIDNGDGTYTTSITSEEPGAATLTAALEGQLLTNTVSMMFDPAPDMETTTLTATPVLVFADGVTVADILVELRDSDDERIMRSGGVLTLEASVGTLSSVTDHGNGTYTATVRSNTVGESTITAALRGTALATSVQVEFDPAPDRTTSQVTATPELVFADGVDSAEILVELRDSDDQPIVRSGGTVTLRLWTGSEYEDIETTDNLDGTYSAELTSTEVGYMSVEAHLEGTALTNWADIEFDPVPDVTQSMFTATPTYIAADGEAETTLQVQLVNVEGDQIGRSGGTVTVETELGDLSPVTDNGDGTYSVMLSSTEIGDTTVTAYLNGEELSEKPVVELLDPSPPVVVAFFRYVRADPETGEFHVLLDATGSTSPTLITGWQLSWGDGGSAFFTEAELGELPYVYHSPGEVTTTLTATNRAGKSASIDVETEFVAGESWWNWDDNGFGFLGGKGAVGWPPVVLNQEDDGRLFLAHLTDDDTIMYGEIQLDEQGGEFAAQEDGFPASMIQGMLPRHEAMYVIDDVGWLLSLNPDNMAGPFVWDERSPNYVPRLHSAPGGDVLVTTQQATYSAWPDSLTVPECEADYGDTSLQFGGCTSGLLVSFSESGGLTWPPVPLHLTGVPQDLPDAVHVDGVFYSTTTDLHSVAVDTDGTIYVLGISTRSSSWWSDGGHVFPYDAQDEVFAMVAAVSAQGDLLWQEFHELYRCEYWCSSTYVRTMGDHDQLALSGDTLYFGLVVPYTGSLADSSYEGLVFMALDKTDGAYLWSEEYFGTTMDSILTGYVRPAADGDAIFAVQTDLRSFDEVRGLSSDRIHLVVRRYPRTAGGPSVAFAQELSCSSAVAGLILRGESTFILDYIDAGDGLTHPETDTEGCWSGQYIGPEHAPTIKRIDWPQN